MLIERANPERLKLVTPFISNSPPTMATTTYKTFELLKKARVCGHNIRHEKRRGFHATPALFFKGRPLPKFPIGIAVNAPSFFVEIVAARRIYRCGKDTAVASSAPQCCGKDIAFEA